MVRTRLARGLGSASIIGSLVVACASTDVEDINDTRDAGVTDASLDVTVTRADASAPKPPQPTEDTGTTPPDPIDTGTGGVCPSSCTYDSECQSACPAPPTGGQNCCDVGSNACFVSASGDCTMGGGGDDGGLDGGTD